MAHKETMRTKRSRDQSRTQCLVRSHGLRSASVATQRQRKMQTSIATSNSTKQFWSIIGAISGGAMGFIVANMPGAIAGAVGGNRLGAIRDKRGKSVYSVYQELEQPERMRLLSELASKVFAHAIS